MAKSSKGPNLNMFGGLVILGILVVGVLVANSQLTKTQDVRQEAAKPVAQTASLTIVEASPQLLAPLHFTYVLPKGVKEDPTGSGTQARIQIMCTQDGEVVYGVAFNAIDIKADGMILGAGSSLWTNEPARSILPADCVATLYQWLYQGQQTFNPFATINFTAAGKTQ